MAGKHRAKKHQSEAYVWLGTGAMTLGLGVALAAGSGVAQADTTNASVSGSRVYAVAGAFRSDDFDPYHCQRTERKYVNSFIHARGCRRGTQATSIVSTKESVVRQMTPADTGDNDPRKDPTVVSQLLGLANNDPGSVLVPTFRSSSWAAVVAACSRRSQVLSVSSSAAEIREPTTESNPRIQLGKYFRRPNA